MTQEQTSPLYLTDSIFSLSVHGDDSLHFGLSRDVVNGAQQRNICTHYKDDKSDGLRGPRRSAGQRRVSDAERHTPSAGWVINQVIPATEWKSIRTQPSSLIG